MHPPIHFVRQYPVPRPHALDPEPPGPAPDSSDPCSGHDWVQMFAMDEDIVRDQSRHQ